MEFKELIEVRSGSAAKIVSIMVFLVTLFGSLFGLIVILFGSFFTGPVNDSDGYYYNILSQLLWLLLLMPFLYTVIAYIATRFFCFLYNKLSTKIGGIQFKIR